MTAVVTLTEDDMIAAVQEYLASRGWIATRVEIDHFPEGPRYQATATVEAPKPVPVVETEPGPFTKPKLWRPREVTIPHGGYPVA